MIPEALKELFPNSPDSIDGPIWSTVYKDVETGQDRWATITAAAMWDRQGEFLPPEAMDWAISFGKIVGLGPLRYKHFPGLDGGDCDRQIRVGDFLFESGTFRDDQIGLAMKHLLETDPGWQISPGLLFGKEDLVNGVYKRAWLFERSLTKVPAIPATATVSVLAGGMQMKQLSEQELLQVAKELSLDAGYVRQLHTKALAGGIGVGMKEFTDTVMKDMREKTRKMAIEEDPEDELPEDEEVEDEEDKKEKLKEVLDSLTEEQRSKMLEMMGVQVQVKEQDSVLELRQQMYDLTCIVEKMATQQQDSGLSGVIKEWAGSLPRRQAEARFSVRKEKSQDVSETDQQIMDTLGKIEAQLKEQDGSRSLAGLYGMFTSKQLNGGQS